MRAPSGTRALRQLAQLYGVQTAYYDVNRRRRSASVEALLAALRSLGAPVASLHDVAEACRERRQAVWQRPLEPVLVAWDGEPPSMELRLPDRLDDVPLAGRLLLESGELQSWQWRVADLPVLRAADLEGTRYVVRRLRLPGGLPHGYHRFVLELPGNSVETLIIVAPSKAYTPPQESEDRTWGVFMPLYALHSQGSWQSGDISDLESLVAWVNGKGGGVVATLPLLATFPNQVSPYQPVSRLLWNELYLDVDSVSELQKCPAAQEMLASASFEREVEALRGLPLVDYGREMALKRRILEEMCRCLFAEASDRLQSLQRFAEAHPVAGDYARFRAVCENQGQCWRSWPQPLRDGVLRDGDYDDEARRYHLYVQWLAHEQMRGLFESAYEKGVRFYLDLPLGVDPDGYDVWSQRSIFAADASAGAPPDAVFTRGQNWWSPPLHPETLRQRGYSYFIACLRHHLQHRGILRIDHVMAFHRLFWIPKGLDASGGVYVRYPAHEFYAIVSLESHRHQCWVVGENLGTVPSYVNRALRQHNVHRMHVVEYELAAEPNRVLRRAPANSVASINTHDMPTFAGFWRALDIKEREQLGLLDNETAHEELRQREALKEALVAFLQRKGLIAARGPSMDAILRATLAFLSASPAQAVLVNLEDLWLETQSQNVPGTGDDFGNWRHKSRHSFEAFCQLPQVDQLLGEVERIRRERKNDYDAERKRKETAVLAG
jgi:4-alpha-glucanotransferase